MEIRIRKAKSGNSFKFKYRIIGVGDVTITEAKMMVRDCNKDGKDINYSKPDSLTDEDFLKGIMKIDEKVTQAAQIRNVASHIKRVASSNTTKDTGKRAKKASTVKKAKALKPAKGIPTPRVSLTTGEQIDVISSINARVGTGNGQYVILEKLKKMKKASINQVITEILRDDIKKHGVDYVLSVKGWQYYPNLKKNVAVMKRLNLLTVVDRVRLDGMVRMEEILQATGVK